MNNVTLKKAEGFEYLLYECEKLNIDNIKESYNHVKPIYEKHASKYACALDIGAFMGAHSLILAQLYNTVYSFEPQTYSFYNLCANLYINKVMNVNAYNLACLDKETNISLNKIQYAETKFTPEGYFDYWNSPNAPSLCLTEDKYGQFKAITIDSLNIKEKIALIKCDAQGADLKALVGARELILRNKPVIIFEYEPVLAINYHRQSYDNDYEPFFKEINYSVTNIHGTFDYLCEPKS